jgi:16S rRNA (guanine966-N2)-methyltransferase
MLRVTSGILRGFKMEVPDVAEVRPPLEMARQAVFNILGQDLEGMRVLDLFAGSGIMGIEALSRGAERAVFVEKDRLAIGTIERNLQKAKMTDIAVVVRADAFRTERYLATERGMDIVFVDPPFEMIRMEEERRRIAELVDALYASPALAQDATVIVRVPKGEALEPGPVSAVVDDDRQYGHSRILFFARAAGGDESAGSEGPSPCPLPEGEGI